MKITICDICNKELADDRGTSLYTRCLYLEGNSQSKDLCDMCTNQINLFIEKLESYHIVIKKKENQC